MGSLYQKLGGEPTVKLVVARLYDKILSDHFLAPVFEPYDMNFLKRQQVAFFAQALGGGATYYGRGMEDAHAHLGLTDRHFDGVVGYLVATLRELQVDADDIDVILNLLAPLRLEIVRA